MADDGTGQVKESRRSKKGKNAANVNGGSGTSTPSAGQAQASAAAARLEEEAAATAAAAAAAAALSPDDKKRRALMKKLTAIDQLKAKKAAGEKLELTQHKKLERYVVNAARTGSRLDCLTAAFCSRRKHHADLFAICL